MSPSARLAGDVPADRLQWPHPQMLAAAGDIGVPKRTPAGTGSAVPADLREAPLPPVIAERLAAAERDAYARGFAAGQLAGESEAAARTDAMFQRLEQTIADIAVLRGGIVQRTEREIVRLAIAIAERVLHRAVTADPARLLEMARAAIARLGDHAAATIHLHPADLEIVTRATDVPAAASAIALVGDHHVPRGGCLVRSAFGIADLAIEAQMREIAREFLGDDEPGPAARGDDPPAGTAMDHDGPPAI